MDDFWSLCLAHFEQTLSAQNLNVWIRTLSVQIQPGSITLSAPNQFAAQHVRGKFLKDIERLAGDYFPETPVIQVVIAGGVRTASTGVTQANSLPVARETTSAVTPQPAVMDRPVLGESRLKRQFTFDTLVPGKANDLARAAALQVADNPGGGYNPLFVYGGVGLGKTHLIQAIGNRVMQLNPKAKVSYIHAERYVSDYVRAVRSNAFDDFKRRYDSLDLLLVDDIQFIARKESTQEQFFYTFNTFIDEHRQLIITSDTFPKDLSGIEDRLKSRFNSGLTVMLEPPELEMRVAILLDKARKEGASLDEGTAFFIAKQVRSNVRELEGALNRVVASAKFNKQPISIDIAKEALKDLLAVQFRQISIENIQKTVAEYYKIKIADLFSRKRTRDIVLPRQVAMLLARELTNMSYPDIGKAFGGKDHSTVMHACEKIEGLKQSDQILRRDYNYLLQALQG